MDDDITMSESEDSMLDDAALLLGFSEVLAIALQRENMHTENSPHDCEDHNDDDDDITIKLNHPKKQIDEAVKWGKKKLRTTLVNGQALEDMTRILKRPATLQDDDQNNCVQIKKIKLDGLMRQSKEDLDGEKEFLVQRLKKSLAGKTRNSNKETKRKNRSISIDICKRPILNPSRGLPDEYVRKIREMNAANLQLVITKRLTASDCRKSQQRLSMPLTQTANFLEEDEKLLLQGRKKVDENTNPVNTRDILEEKVHEKKESDKKKRKNNKKKNDDEISVVLIQPSLHKIDMNLRQWEMNTSKMYVLVSPWHQVRLENNLFVGDAIQVWSFRIDNKKLGLAIVKLDD